MKETKTRVTVVLVIAIVLASLSAPAIAPTASAQESQSADEYFDTLRGMSDLAIYEEYSELETLHTQSLSAVQVGEFTDEEARELDLVIATIRSFEKAQARFEDGEYEAGFEAATEIEANISELESYDESLAVLSTLALTRYYESLGDELASQAEATDNTPREIELRQLAADAYRGANNPTQAAEFTRQVERLDAELTADRERMDEAEESMSSFSGACTTCESPSAALGGQTIGVIGHYETALEVTPMLSDATQRADRHGLEDRRATLEEQTATARTMQSSLAVASTIVLVGYGVLVGLLVALVSSRIFAWQRAFEAANLDSVIAMGDSDV